MNQLFRRKPIADCEHDIAERSGLQRALSKWHLTAFGVGATIGAGIFATTGTAIVGESAPAPGAGAGPHHPLLRAHGVACGFAALCYAEFAAMVPHRRLGVHLRLRLAGRVRGLDHRVGPDRRVRGGQHRRGDRVERLLPEFAPYRVRHSPAWLADRHGYRTCRCRQSPDPDDPRRCSSTAPRIFGVPIILNVPAFLIVMFVTVLLVIGIKESIRVNNVDGAASRSHHSLLLRGRSAYQAIDPDQLRAGGSRRTAGPASARARPSSSSATSGSMPSRPPPRRRRTRRRTCRSASS